MTNTIINDLKLFLKKYSRKSLQKIENNLFRPVLLSQSYMGPFIKYVGSLIKF